MVDLTGIDRHLVESSPVGAWVLERDGTTVWFNSVMCTFLGRSPAELDGLRAHVAFDEQSQHQFDFFLERMRASEDRASGRVPVSPPGQLDHLSPDHRLHVDPSRAVPHRPPSGRLRPAPLAQPRAEAGSDSEQDEQLSLRLPNRRVILVRRALPRGRPRSCEESAQPGVVHPAGRRPGQGADRRSDRGRRVRLEVRIRRPSGDVVWLRMQSKSPACGVGRARPCSSPCRRSQRRRESSSACVKRSRLARSCGRSPVLPTSPPPFGHALPLLPADGAFDPSARLTTFQPLVFADVPSSSTRTTRAATTQV